MPQAYETLRKFALHNEIIIVSSGYSPNLKAKERWCKEHFRFVSLLELISKNIMINLI